VRVGDGAGEGEQRACEFVRVRVRARVRVGDGAGAGEQQIGEFIIIVSVGGRGGSLL
jgi:hypothetical protein